MPFVILFLMLIGAGFLFVLALVGYVIFNLLAMVPMKIYGIIAIVIAIMIIIGRWITKHRNKPRDGNKGGGGSVQYQDLFTSSDTYPGGYGGRSTSSPPGQYDSNLL